MMIRRCRHPILCCVAAYLLAACGSGAPGMLPEAQAPDSALADDVKLHRVELDDQSQAGADQAPAASDQAPAVSGQTPAAAEPSSAASEVLLQELKVQASQQVDAAIKCQDAGEAAAKRIGGSFTTATNDQEAGIGEQDLVKVVGDFAYILRQKTPGDGGQLRVVKIRPTTEFAQRAMLEFPGTPLGLQATDTHLAVLSAVGPKLLQLDLLHIQNPDDPTPLRTYQFGSSLAASRLIGSTLFLVMNGQPSSAWHKQLYSWNPTVDDCAAKLGDEQKKLKAAVENLTITDFLTTMQEITGSLKQPIGVDAIYTNVTNGDAQLIIAAFDMTGERDERVDMVHGAAHMTYVSHEAVYVAQKVSAKSKQAPVTAIHQFDLAGESAEYVSTGGVPGALLNQFAMSEYKGVLRVAAGGKKSKGTNIYLLDATVPGLPELGKVTALGKGENLQAVRFVEDKGYVVTFKKIDPLFVIDLADPKNPYVAGELKVPGFSTYLHPIADGTLIGLGKDTDDQGAFAWFGGLKLSLFDVSNPVAPNEVTSTMIGVRGSDSPALGDHHAFTYDAARRLLALPVSVCEGTDGTGSTFGTLSYSGLHLYEVRDTGFTLIGTVQDKTKQVGKKCKWWGNFGTVDRAVILGDGTSKQVLVARPQSVELFDVAAGGLTSVGKVE